jgi:hypothetical protein
LGASSSQYKTTQEQKKHRRTDDTETEEKGRKPRTGRATQEYQADRENKRSKKKPSKAKQDQRRSAQRIEAEGKKVALVSPPSCLHLLTR